jgi:general secretion pathway protein K
MMINRSGYASYYTTMRRRSATKHHSKQQGVALITVLVVVALMSVIVTQISSGHILNSRRTQNTIFTDQAFLYVLSAEELAAQMLNLFQQTNQNKPIKLSDPWTEPFMFPLDNGMIEGTIKDGQACFNLNSVSVNTHNPPQQNNPPNQGNNTSGGLNPVNGSNPQLLLRKPITGEQLFARLIELVSLGSDILAQHNVRPEELAAAVRDWIDADNTFSGNVDTEEYFYSGRPIGYRNANQMFASITELRLVRGFSQPVYDLIKPYVCVIPGEESGKININTIDAGQPELLEMLYKDMSKSAASAILTNPMRRTDGLTQQSLDQLVGNSKIEDFARDRISFDTSYFVLEASAQLDGRYSNIVSIFSKRNGQFKVLHRHFGEQ